MATSPCTSMEQDESVETPDSVIAEFQTYSVFIETRPERCFLGDNLLEKIIQPSLSEENFCRGEMGLTVGFKTETGEHDQLSFKSGYEFDHDTEIKFSVDNKSHSLILEEGGKRLGPVTQMKI